MKERQAVTREYKPRYQKAQKKEKTVKIKPEKKRLADRKGKQIYPEETIACLRMVWVFLWYKCRKILAPLIEMRHFGQ